MQPRICIWVSVCVCIYICISVPFVCEVELENKYSILFYSILNNMPHTPMIKSEILVVLIGDNRKCSCCIAFKRRENLKLSLEVW